MDRLITIVLSIISFTLSVNVVAECQFIKVGYTVTNQVAFIGIYYHTPMESYDCVENAFVNTPSALNAAQAFGVLSSLSTGALMLILFVQTCSVISNQNRMAVALFYVLCFIFQILTFSLFAIDICKEAIIKCSIGPDGTVSIVAALFHLACAIVNFMVPVSEEAMAITAYKAIQGDSKPGYRDRVFDPGPNMLKSVLRESVCESADPKGNKTITKITVDYGDGGDKITTTETTDPDGSITITKTTETEVKV